MTIQFHDANHNDVYIFQDLETTGLNSKVDLILEGAFIAVDSSLNEIKRLHFFMNYNLPMIKAMMNQYVRDMHTTNGLLDRLEKAKNKLSEDEAKTVLGDFIKDVKKPNGRVLIAGNSLHGVDYPFLKEYFPSLFNSETGIHYRAIDVSGICEAIALYTGRYPAFLKDGGHRAMGDAMQCLEEFKAVMAACINH